MIRLSGVPDAVKELPIAIDIATEKNKWSIRVKLPIIAEPEPPQSKNF